MLSKIDIIKDKILADISNGNLLPGQPLPSRHQLMRKSGYARATIDTAIKDLVSKNYLYSVRGAGTYVAPPKAGKTIQKVYVVNSSSSSVSAEHEVLSVRIATALQSSIETVIIHWDELQLSLRNVLFPGNAVIWIRPTAIQLSLIQYLANGSIPQLLIGRSYSDFSYITTDAAIGIMNALKWLKENSVNELAFITSENDPMLPYIAERYIAFYQSCVELGIHLKPENIFILKGENPAHEMHIIAKRFFSGDKRPDGIFTSNIEVMLPLLSLGESYGVTPGKDYLMASFDHQPKLDKTRGICMLRQRWGRMGKLAVEWVLKDACKNKKTVIKIEPKTIIGG